MRQAAVSIFSLTSGGIFRGTAARLAFRWLGVLLAGSLSLIAAGAHSQDHLSSAGEVPAPLPPRIAEASDEGERALAGFQLPPGIVGQLWAAEPMLANPVAFDIDGQGRIYVCETFRQNQGVEDNRGHAHWLDDDLAAQTVEDRLAYLQKHLGPQLVSYTRQDDRLRLLEDRDGDGRADQSTVFADRFNGPLEGTLAGVLALGRDVYATCIPHLWLLRDTDGDGRCDVRQSLSYGYGVRYAFRGHDLHGLILGPDGRLYFSVGDRGLFVRQQDRVLANPESGAVLRCERDGSRLELFATGLRNPQELAFDDEGELFTGDNNSDSGDRARWVHVVEGGDSGWRMAYQYLPDRGPFNRERLWHLPHEGQPAYIVPPVAHLASGPSGVAYDPGTGLTEHFRGRFLLVDFRGQPAGSGVRSFRLRPKGASFELVDSEQTIWNVLATDVAVGPDGALYLSDWVNGWNGEGKGRIYRFQAAPGAVSPQAEQLRQQVHRLLASPWHLRETSELADLLAHPDRRVRQQAQQTLVERGEVDALLAVARSSGSRLARLHAIWGLAQCDRLAGRPGTNPPYTAQVIGLLEDADASVRAAVAWALGEAALGAARDALIAHLRDENLRVRRYAAISLGKLGQGEAIAPLLGLLADNDDRDPVLRHAAVMGLVGACGGQPQRLVAAARGAPPAARLGVILALRRLASEEVARYLDDPEPRLVLEAARAIYDVPIAEALPRLAAILDRAGRDEALVLRVLNAHFRLGTRQSALALAAYAAKPSAPTAMRLEALELLALWGSPPSRDRVLGMWRPLAPRPAEAAAEALRLHLGGVFRGSEAVRAKAGDVAARLGLPEVLPHLHDLLGDPMQPAEARAAVLTALASLHDPDLDRIAREALADPSAVVRAAARALLAQRGAMDAAALLVAATRSGERIERQAAWAALGNLRSAEAEAAMDAALDQLLAGSFPADTQLDLIQAAQRQGSLKLQEKLQQYEARRPADDPLAPWSECLEGGDAARGRQLFFERSQLSCVRCHKVGTTGGDVGPDLTRIAADKPRAYLLEAIVAPSRTIARNYETTVVLDAQGQQHTGIVRHEDDRVLTLITAEGKLVTIPQAQIEARKSGTSAMPADLTKYLTKSELRDLVEFLASLR
jgi:quinoprotein glucose dehydrogenase